MKAMKTKLKILYKTPDLDALAEKHEDFGGLMDAFTDEKIRKRKKLYRFSSFAIVIFSTAFLSWLYWGYEPASSNADLPAQQAPPVVVTEDKEKKPEGVVQKEEAVQKPKPVTTQPSEAEIPVATKATETPKKASETAPTQKKVSESEEMAMPSVTITRKESVDATPEDGLENLYRYLYSKVEIPDSLLNERGGFFLEITFNVERSGEISEVKFDKELPADLRERLTEVFVNMPAWKPAEVGEQAVRSEVKLPITFQKKD